MGFRVKRGDVAGWRKKKKKKIGEVAGWVSGTSLRPSEDSTRFSLGSVLAWDNWWKFLVGTVGEVAGRTYLPPTC